MSGLVKPGQIHVLVKNPGLPQVSLLRSMPSHACMWTFEAQTRLGTSMLTVPHTALHQSCAFNLA